MQRDLLPRIVAVIGPTGSGKTALGVQIAKRYGGEIVSVDSKQVYRGMDIGTAKEKELPVPQHLIDVLDPGEKVTVAWFQQEAYRVIDQLLGRPILPVLVGASMLYAEAIMNGYLFPSEPVSRQEVLAARARGEKTIAQKPRYQCLKLGIRLPSEIFKQRIEARTNQWIKDGLLEEIRSLLDSGVSADWLYSCGQEYRYFTAYLQGKTDLAEATQLTNRSLYQYTKRQYTWWRKHPDLYWISQPEEAFRIIDDFLGRTAGIANGEAGDMTAEIAPV